MHASHGMVSIEVVLHLRKYNRVHSVSLCIPITPPIGVSSPRHTLLAGRFNSSPAFFYLIQTGSTVRRVPSTDTTFRD